MKGSKEIAANNMNVKELLQRGYVVFSIDYRLAPEFLYPAQIEDVKCAVRYIRAHAEEYGIDINRIGALGGSAGGHLVSLLGTSDDDFYNSTGGYTGQSARVQAVVDCYGPADLTAEMGNNNNGVLLQVYGTFDRTSPVLREASPVTYATEDDPPFLILHGNRDVVVPVTQSELMDDALDEQGVPSELVIVKNAGHGFSPTDSPIEPSRFEITGLIADFFDKYLRN
jgi:acetyl esterase/lipase